MQILWKMCQNLDASKATPVGDIPANILKCTVDIHLLCIPKIINVSFQNGRFSDELKLADVSPTFKKNDDLDKEKACQHFISCVKGLSKNDVHAN